METFVERIIQETFFEAFYEYYMLKKKESGTANLSYETTGDDEVVTLRKKIKPNGLTLSNKRQAENKTDGKNLGSSYNCVHKKVQNVSCYKIIYFFVIPTTFKSHILLIHE